MAHYSNGNGSSLSDLERQAESSRAELAQTVDALQNRVSPDTLKRDAKNYARQTGQQFLGAVEEKARDNPLAAVAVAAGLALPLWRIVSNIPAPILLIGAGLAMSRRGSGGSGSDHAWARQAASGDGPSLSERASGLARSISEKATDVIEDTQYNAGVMTSRVTDAVGDKVDAVREMASEAAATVTGTASDLSRQAADGLDRARNSLTETVERHPLLVGGLVFAIGGLLASSLPATRAENRLMGSASDDIRKRAKTIAEDGAEALQTAASEVYEDVAAQTRAQGLTPDTARGAVKTAVEQAGAVIDKAASAVESQRSTSTGNRPLRKQKIINPESDNG